VPNLVPGFTWHPVDVGRRAARRKGRGHVAHVAVSSSALLVPGPLASRSADWHFYLPKTGPGIQMIDLDLQSWSSSQGNASTTASEAEGGFGSAAEVNAEPWSPDQFENLARILAYENETEGVPLQVMSDSRPASQGLAPHRWGIDPWRVSGGESWSSSRGKICPGDTKVGQLRDIVARAVEIRHGSPAPAPAPAPSGAPPRLAWILPPGHYVGAMEGPAQSHGGDARYDSPDVRNLVRNVLQWFVYHGCVPGVPAAQWATTGWTNTGWEGRYTDPVCAAWHARFYPGQPKPTQIWQDDYDRLARP
jgi:N-acetylmuramoyl-L-alanine amidase